MLDKLTQADFAPHVNSTFRVRLESAPPLEVELIQATLVGRQVNAGDRQGRRAPFALLFRGPLKPWLLQGTHALEHEQLGGLDLFLVPVGPDEHGMQYEAIFT
jgi:hypothetical protein